MSLHILVIFHFIPEALRRFLSYFELVNAGEEVSTLKSLKKYKLLLIVADCGLFRRNTDFFANLR